MIVKIEKDRDSTIETVEKQLRDGESNPGLPRDRRGYSPLYYRGVIISPCWADYTLGDFESLSKWKSAIGFAEISTKKFLT